jgi:multidrug efflux pump subunit AcrA (membrane-fusion protein)
VVKPEVRTITRTVGQPSFVDAYEQTAIYPKQAGYVQKWHVDIGDRVRKDQLLLTLFIPELEEEHKLKLAQALMEQALVEQAGKLVEVAEGNLKAAAAQVAEARANVGKYEAEIERWSSEVTRLRTLTKERVVDRQVLDESVRQLKSNTASRDAAQASVQSASANQAAMQAALDKAKVDVKVALGRLQVAQADEKRLAALVGYTRLTAPYDGVIVARNVNTGDFVLPAAGDPSAPRRSPDQSAGRATPLYVVARTDVVRVYVDVPESEAPYIVSEVDRKNGDKRDVTRAHLRIPALPEAEFPTAVTRTAWALTVRSRTLRTEIDLPNAQSRLLPGMYAYGSVTIDRPQVLALPQSAVVEIGNQVCCYLYENGKAVRTRVQTGLGDGTWIEVVRKENGQGWAAFSGAEEVIVGDLTELSDGQAVIMAKD